MGGTEDAPLVLMDALQVDLPQLLAANDKNRVSFRLLWLLENSFQTRPIW
jgi:hypothetical protein